LMFNFMSSLYILDINPLFRELPANIFLLFCGSLDSGDCFL
jgi:hypothetical protein